MPKVRCKRCGYVENEEELTFVEGKYDDGNFYPKKDGGSEEHFICGGCGEYLHPDYDVEYDVE